MFNPEHGFVSTTGGIEFGAVATYTCEMGFDLAGDDTATCTAVGAWSSIPPLCNRISKYFSL